MMPPKQTPEERAKALEAFRHEQTVKRWHKGSTKKPSKIIYMSDFLGGGSGTGLLKRQRRQSQARGAGILASGTLLLGGHRGGGGVVSAHGGCGDAKTKGPQLTGQRGGAKLVKPRDPNAEGPFNHRKPFSALKRRIHAQRKAAMSAYTAAAESPNAVAAGYECQRVSETLDGDDNNNTNVTVDTARLVQAERLVWGMDVLHVRMDAAMRTRQFHLAGQLKRQIRNRRHQLRRLLTCQKRTEAQEETQPRLDPSYGPAAASDNGTEGSVGEQGEDSGAAGGGAAPAVPFYVNHYPPTVLLGVGRHPYASIIDKRTGRYPQKLDVVAVRTFLSGAVAATSDAAQRSDLAALCLEAGSGPNDRQVASKRRPAAVMPLPFVGHYCRNTITDFLDDLAFTTLQGLYGEQRELKQRQPMQFKARQRYVVGLSETLKHLRAGRVKLVLLASDIEVRDAAAEPTPTDGAGRRSARKFQTLDEALALIAAASRREEDPVTEGTAPAKEVPTVITCMSRQRLSYALVAKGSSVACVGILHAEKHLELVKALRVLGTGLQTAYAEELRNHTCDSGTAVSQ